MKNVIFKFLNSQVFLQMEGVIQGLQELAAEIQGMENEKEFINKKYTKYEN